MDKLDELLGMDQVKTPLEAASEGVPRHNRPGHAWGPSEYFRRYEPIYDLINTLRTVLFVFAVLVGLALLIGLSLMSGENGPPTGFKVIYGVGCMLTIGFLLTIRTALLLGTAVVDIAVHTAPLSDENKATIISAS